MLFGFKLCPVAIPAIFVFCFFFNCPVCNPHRVISITSMEVLVCGIILAFHCLKQTKIADSKFNKIV